MTTAAALSRWLSPVESLPLECDGLTRVVSILLARERIDHAARMGALRVGDLGSIPMHCWIELQEHAMGGYVIDYRVQEWVPKAPASQRGIFVPAPIMQYEWQVPLSIRDPEFLFGILTNMALEDFPRLASED